MFLRVVPLLLLVGSALSDCPPGSSYNSDFNKCYQYFSSPLPFLAAEQQCNSIGGHLADIQNAFENYYIAGEAGHSDFWIGANLLLSSTWSWTSNSPMSFTNWGNGQPVSTNPCGYVKNSDNTWSSVSCNNQLPFMCTICQNSTQPGASTTQATVTSPSPSGGNCTNGYSVFSGNGMCYKYHTELQSFDQANTTCANEGGMLAKIPSKDVNYFLTKLPGIRCSGSTCPFIGLSCSKDDVFSCYWVDGTPLMSYRNFYWGMGYGFLGVYDLVTDDTLAGHYGRWEKATDAHAFLCQKRP